MPSNKKQLIIMIAAFLFILVFGQGLPPQPDIPKPPELKVVRDWKFEKPIKDFALGTIIKDKDTIVYPKILVFEDEIRGYDEKGEMVWNHQEENTLTFLDPSVSANGNFVVITVWHKPQVSNEEWGQMKNPLIRQTKFFNDRGQLVWHSTIDTFWEGGSYLTATSDNGSLVLVDPTDATFEFISPLGKRIKKIKLLEGENWKRTAGAAFSDNGDYVGLFVAEPPTNDTMNNAVCGLFDKWGKELWRYNSCDFRNIKCSKNSRFVLINGEKKFSEKSNDYRGFVSLFDKMGNLIKSYEVPRFFGVPAVLKFSPNEYYAIISRGVDSGCILIDARKGSTLWENSMNGKKIISVAVFNNGACLISTGHGDHRCKSVVSVGRCSCVLRFESKF